MSIPSTHQNSENSLPKENKGLWRLYYSLISILAIAGMCILIGVPILAWIGFGEAARTEDKNMIRRLTTEVVKYAAENENRLPEDLSIFHIPGSIEVAEKFTYFYTDQPLEPAELKRRIIFIESSQPWYSKERNAIKGDYSLHTLTEKQIGALTKGSIK